MVLPILGATLLASCAPLATGPDAAPAAVAAPASCMQQTPQELPAPGTLPTTDPATTPTTAPATEPEQGAAPPADTVGPGIVVTGDAGPPPGDPLAEINEKSFEVVQEIDAAVVEPIAQVYAEAAPKPIRSGLRNFLRNLLEPVFFLNHMLQLRPDRAILSLGRFAINSTVGVAGLVDVARRDPFNLPYRPNGFANTLGYYGVGPGPYFYLPLVGSTTLRDGLAGILDTALFPTVVGAPFNKPWFGPSAYVITSLESRIEFDERSERIANSSDPYTVTRETYLCRRQADIDALRDRPVADCSVAAVKARINGDPAPGVEIIEAVPAQTPAVNDAPAVNDNAAPTAAPAATPAPSAGAAPPAIVLPDFSAPAPVEPVAATGA